MAEKAERFILWLDEVDSADAPLVGSKNASLGEMIRKLAARNILVPNGFAITAEAYRYFMKTAGLEKSIRNILSGLDIHNLNDLMRRGRRVRDIILDAPLPSALVAEIGKAYDDLEDLYGLAGTDVEVAVRSSAIGDLLTEPALAGQQETFLNVRGKIGLIQAVKRCFASLFTNRAIAYRQEHGLDQFDVALSVGVQKMVRSDAAGSGIISSVDPESGFKEVVYITAAYGLGETVVSGLVTPDEYLVFKPTLKQGKQAILSRQQGQHPVKMIYTADETRPLRTIATTEEERRRFVLQEAEILQLAEWACIIEDHYHQSSGVYRPMILEWAKDGDGQLVGTGQLYVLQARPDPTYAKRDFSIIETYHLRTSGRLLTQGQAVGCKIGRGKARLIESSEFLGQFQPGEILVTDMTDPDWEPIMRNAAAIVTNRGGRTCHAAIVSRELGIPCVIGTGNATSVISTGQEITVSGAEGEIGKVYEGLLDFEVERLKIQDLPPTRTQIKMNIGLPERAFLDCQIPNDGVGLARQEFIISSQIGIHPLALVQFDRLQQQAAGDPRLAQVIEQINARSLLYADKTEFYVDRLAQGIGRIAAAFYPKEVIVRLSDFKSSEYLNLVGGYLFEPQESNPMLGWRGASRYCHPDYQPAFALECQAIRRVREDMGLTNLQLLVPFCRTPEEGRQVLELLRAQGLQSGVNGLRIYLMCEIPSNFILAEEFAQLFDGFSIGTNDLTQLTLGLDRDSQLVAHLFDERHAAIKKLILDLIQVAKKYQRRVGICGQAPSDLPDFAAFLVENGIDYLSLNPDAVIKTKLVVAAQEQALGLKG